MKEETLLRGGLAATLLMCITFLFFLAEGWRKVDDAEIKLKKTQDSLRITETLRDSLYDELFNTKVELGRHELTRDYFFSKYPKLQLEYVNYLYHETE
jgi:hypothetical protein